MSNAVSGTLEVLTHNWWSLVVRGVAAILFGAAVFVTPELTLDALAKLFAAYVIVDGALTLAAGLQERARGQRWGALLLEGIAGFAVGTLFGNAMAQPRYVPAPVYVVPPPTPVYYAPPPWTPEWYAYCARKYGSFDPRSGTFLGYDGYRHTCI